MIYKPKPPMDLPPSTASELPVIMDASSLNSQLTAIATSSIVASLRSGICCFMISKASASHCSRANFVSTLNERERRIESSWKKETEKKKSQGDGNLKIKKQKKI